MLELVLSKWSHFHHTAAGIPQPSFPIHQGMWEILLARYVSVQIWKNALLDSKERIKTHMMCQVGLHRAEHMGKVY